MVPLCSLFSVILQSAPTGNTTGSGTNASGGSGVTTPLSEVANP